MPVLGAHSSSSSHTLKRIVRRSAKSSRVLSYPLGFGHRRCRTAALPDHVQLLQAFRPSALGSVQTGGGNQIDRFQEGPHGGSAVRAFLFQWWPASFASVVWATLPPNRNHVTIRFRSHKRPVAACQQPALSQVTPVTFRTDVTLASVEHRPMQEPEGHSDRQELDRPSFAASPYSAHRRMHLTFSPTNSTRSRSNLVSAAWSWYAHRARNEDHTRHEWRAASSLAPMTHRQTPAATRYNEILRSSTARPAESWPMGIAGT